MGCDIHVYVERPTEGGWEAVDPPEIYWRSYWDGEDYPWKKWPDDRSYYVFSRLARVRYYDDREGQVYGPEPKGLSEGLSPQIRRAWTEGGDHSPSWGTWPEFRDALAAEGFAAAPPSDSDKSWGHGFSQLMHELDSRSDAADLRIVYWFDS